MQLRSILILPLIIVLAACSTEPKAAKYRPPAEQGLAWRILHPFARKQATSSPATVAFKPAPKRGLAWRVLHPFASDGSTPRKSGVQVTVEPDSTTPSLQATRLLGVRVSVTNYKSTMIAITFPTEQRIEITGRTQEGKIFYNYSTDRNFSNEVSVLTINPGERLEYTASVPTRSMSAGSTYIINASVVGQSGMEGAASITPVP